MKLWLISYDGVEFGATAIVSARTAEEAIEALRKDPRSFGAKEATATELHLSDEVPMILYNDNGDY